MFVSSAVLTVLVALPYACSSASWVAYLLLVSWSGGPGRNWDGLSSMNGFMNATQGVCADWADGGGAKIQTPGVKGPCPYGVEMEALRPSPVLSVMMSSAAATPIATPAPLPAAGRPARYDVYVVPSVPACAGK